MPPLFSVQVTEQPNYQKGDVDQKVSQCEAIPEGCTHFSNRLDWFLGAHSHTEIVTESGDVLRIN
ncbi:MAG: hypothetical protein ABIE47_12435 [Pseudomonadota bacterium]